MGATTRQGTPQGPKVPWHALSDGAVLTRLGTGQDGLSHAEADARLRSIGPNVLYERARASIGALLARQLNNPIVYLLIVSSALAFLLGKPTDGAVVLGAVVVNAVIGFLEEFRAGKAIEAISQMVPQEATVVRGGLKQSLPAAALVPGDFVELAAGDRVPADVRLTKEKNLKVDEAALTGESVPVSKALAPVDESAPIGDRICMAFGGTFVTTGAARGVVVATGLTTELGKISQLLEQTSEIQTPLTKAISRVGSWLTVAVVIGSGALLAVCLIRGYTVSEALLVAVALAVASIPEGLPAVITIALAIGVQRMARRRAIVRKLPAVETLGSTTVICTDKTGTLTRNEMTVQVVWTLRGSYSLSGVGYSPRGALHRDGDEGAGLVVHPPPDDVRQLLIAGALCNDASLIIEPGETRIAGDPTEAALLVSAHKVGLKAADLELSWRRQDTIPFESVQQFMATLHTSPDGVGGHIFVKGAPEAILRRCGLTTEETARVLSAAHRLASSGMRVLACAEAEARPGLRELSMSDVEQGLTFLGLQGMIDPPRPEAMAAVNACREAGVVVKMITGDHVATAEAIGAELGILSDGMRGLGGQELAALDPGTLEREAVRTNVFARVAPEQKLALVRALQAQSQVVAMTGDGVNDAPALQQANIGVAMGITGTAAAKEAADIVLADDNFATIAAAVQEGRRIYDNLVKSLAFVLPTNLGLGLILIAAVFFFPLQELDGKLVPLMPARPTQLLWINLVASVGLSLPLAFEVQEPDVMQRAPRRPGAPVFDRFVVVRTVMIAVLMAAGSVGLFWWEYAREVTRVGHEVALSEAQTMAVTTVVLFQIFYLLNCRTLRSSLRRIGYGTNPVIFIGIAVLLGLQAGFIYLPFMQDIFGTAALGPDALLASAVAAAVVFPAMALERMIRRGNTAWTNRTLRRPVRV